MDPSPIQSSQPQVIPPPQPSIPTPPSPVAPAKPKKVFLTVLIVLIVLLALGAAGFFAFRYMQQKQQAAISTFEECIKASGSMVQASYPATCVTRDGRRFPQPLTEEEKQNLLPPVGPQIYGIQLTECCSCPTLIDSSQIGQNDWVTYEQGKDYASQRPTVCSTPNIGICAPCPPLETGKPLECTYKGKVYNSGESVPSGDNCNTCSCNNGQVACTLMACSPTTGYTCPANGWVDCMPGPDPKPQCSSDAMAWYKANCLDFKGGAL